MNEANAKPYFGTLVDVELRDAWPNESTNFTPWLAENLSRLSEVIGIELELEGTEVAVGQYWADILARDLQTDTRVLIENQLEWSDHSHIGQILTYIAGLDARIVVWIARGFAEPHLSAIRWLNDHTDERFAFFAAQLRVVQIADSPLVPLFEIVEKPNNWEREVREINRSSGIQSELSKVRRDFWTHYSQRHPKDGMPANYMASSSWAPPHPNHPDGPRISLGLAGNFVRIFFDPYKISSEEMSDWVIQRGVHKELGIEAVDDPLCDQREDFDGYDRDNWDAMVDWLHEKLQEYRRVFDAELES